MRAVNYLFSLGFIVLTFTCQAQDKVSVSSLKINNQISIKSSRAHVIQALGQPSSSEMVEFEMGEKTVEMLTYGDSKLYLDQGILVTFELYDSPRFLQIGSTAITVGSNVSNLQNVFPNSYNIRFTHSNGATLVLKLEATVNGSTFLLDNFVSIAFDSATGTITSIVYVTP